MSLLVTEKQENVCYGCEIWGFVEIFLPIVRSFH